jgi:hypothetical protein
MEGVEEDARVVMPIPDAVEARDLVLSARHRLAVDDAGARASVPRRRILCQLPQAPDITVANAYSRSVQILLQKSQIARS